MKRPMGHQSATSASVLPFALAGLCSQNLIGQLVSPVLAWAKFEGNFEYSLKEYDENKPFSELKWLTIKIFLYLCAR